MQKRPPIISFAGGADGTGTVTIYHQLPAVIEQDESLVFRSKNSTVVVLNWHRTPRDHSLL